MNVWRVRRKHTPSFRHLIYHKMMVGIWCFLTWQWSHRVCWIVHFVFPFRSLPWYLHLRDIVCLFWGLNVKMRGMDKRRHWVLVIDNRNLLKWWYFSQRISIWILVFFWVHFNSDVRIDRHSHFFIRIIIIHRWNLSCVNSHRLRISIIDEYHSILS